MVVIQLETALSRTALGCLTWRTGILSKSFVSMNKEDGEDNCATPYHKNMSDSSMHNMQTCLQSIVHIRNMFN